MNAKIFIAINPEGLKGLAGAGGGPNVLGVFMEELDGITVEWAMLEEGKTIAELVADADIIIPGVSPITAEVLDAAANLKGIVQAGVGLDTVDIPAAAERGIAVVNEPEGSAIAMGEYGMLLILCASRRILEARDFMRQGVYLMPTGAELNGKTLGMVGLGRSARELAKRAGAFGMKMIGVDKYPDAVSIPGVEVLGTTEALDDLLDRSDVVSIHCPATPETRGLIDYGRICRMKSSAVLVNLARAGIVDRDGFIRAVREERIRGAALDVFWDEPMDPADEVMNLPRTVLTTPHIATSTVEARERIFRATARNIKQVLQGEKPANCVT